MNESYIMGFKAFYCRSWIRDVLCTQHLERNSRVLGCMPLVTSTWNVTVGCWDAKHISNHDCGGGHFENPKP